MQIRWKSRESLKTSIGRLVRLFFHILLEMTINISMIFRRRIEYSFLRSRFKDRVQSRKGRHAVGFCAILFVGEDILKQLCCDRHAP